MKSIHVYCFSLCGLSLLMMQGRALAVDGAKGPTVKVSGFVSTSLFVQDRNWGPGNGQKALWVKPEKKGKDAWLADGDIRNTRLRVVVDQPAGEGLAFKSMVEADFFAGFIGEGGLNDEMPIPRLRLAFADVKMGRTTLRFGQYWTPLLGNVPASLMHVAFPLGYGSAGMIGWRFPGMFLYHDLTPADAGIKAQLQFAVFRNSWAGPGDNLDSLSAGNASMVPQIEARLNVASAKSDAFSWKFYVVGHYDRKDMSGVGEEFENDQPRDDTLDSYAAQVGWDLKVSRISLRGNAFWGRAMGHQVAHILQMGKKDTPGDIVGWGAWAQLGFQLTPTVDTQLFFGMDDPDDDDVKEAYPAADDKPRLRNHTMAVMLRYKTGPFQAGIEWIRGELLHSADEKTAIGNQFAFSTMYKF